MLRRLEDRIRILCSRALTAADHELAPILAELQAALREHSERLRRIAILKLTGIKGEMPPERRSSPGRF